MTFSILRGDARHLPLADGSVHCCVTSPPYWRLRDYGTAQWVGGDPECDHQVGRFTTPASEKQRSNAGSGQQQARETCPKCGAVRVDSQLGLEPTPDAYVANMVAVFREVWRVLRPDGTVWLNLGDCYASGGREGHGTRVGYKQQTNRGMNGTCDPVRAPQPDGLKPKDLVGIPWRVAFALQADGWWLRSDIVWAKGLSFCKFYAGSCMPESVTDRPTSAHEHLFLLAKAPRYYYDNEAVKEAAMGKYDPDFVPKKRDWRTGNPVQATNPQAPASGRNLRNVWAINPAGFPGAHFATMPPALVEPCIKAGTSERGCCPRCGAPWERVVERTGEPDPSAKGSRFDVGKTGVNGQGRVQAGERYLTQSVGWQPTCGCGEEPVPCVVLDPFSGAGTTCLVADRLGRHGVGVELSGEYTMMARRRCYEDAPLLAFAT